MSNWQSSLEGRPSNETGPVVAICMHPDPFDSRVDAIRRPPHRANLESNDNVVSTVVVVAVAAVWMIHP